MKDVIEVQRRTDVEVIKQRKLKNEILEELLAEIQSRDNIINILIDRVEKIEGEK